MKNKTGITPCYALWIQSLVTVTFLTSREGDWNAGTYPLADVEDAVLVPREGGLETSADPFRPFTRSSLPDLTTSAAARAGPLASLALPSLCPNVRNTHGETRQSRGDEAGPAIVPAGCVRTPAYCTGKYSSVKTADCQVGGVCGYGERRPRRGTPYFDLWVVSPRLRRGPRGWRR